MLKIENCYCWGTTCNETHAHTYTHIYIYSYNNNILKHIDSCGIEFWPGEVKI